MATKRPKKSTEKMPDNRRRHSLRGANGQFISNRTKKPPVERWNQPGPSGFWNWLADIEPRILSRRNQYDIFTPTENQCKRIDDILEVDETDNFIHSLSLLIEPRRHGKSTILAMIILWLITSRRNLTVQLLGNTEGHTRRVQFRTLERIILNTPKLRRLIPEKCILSFEIKHPAMGSVIQMGTGVNVATSFGDKINVLWVSDFHATPDLGPWNALQAALLDSENSLCLIDSNVDHTDGHVHSLQREAAQDPSIFCNHIWYKDLSHYAVEAPVWIDRQKARRLQRTVLEVDFKRDILGQRSDAKNALFSRETIELCKSRYKVPVSDLTELIKGRSYKVGGGLGRAKSLIGGDNTVWTVILKVASPEHGETERLAELKEYNQQSTPNMTYLREAAAKYLLYCEKHFTRTTFTDKKKALAELGAVVGNVPIDKIDSNKVLHEVLLSQKTNALHNKRRKDLHAFFEHCRKFLGLKLNPISYIERLPIERKPQIVPTEKEFLRLMMAADRHDRNLLIAFATTGGRRSEVLRWTWTDDINFGERKVRFGNRKNRAREMRYRWVDMNDELYDALQDQWKARLTHSDYVFQNRMVWKDKEGNIIRRHPGYGGRYTTRRRFMSGLCKKANINKQIRFHSLRRFFASLLAENHESLPTIQKLLGHAAFSTTDRYIHRLKNDTRSAVQKIDFNEKAHEKAHAKKEGVS